MLRAKYEESIQGCTIAARWGTMHDQLYINKQLYNDLAIHELKRAAVEHVRGNEDSESDVNQNSNMTDVVIKLQQSNHSVLRSSNTPAEPRATSMKASLTRLQEARDALAAEAGVHRVTMCTTALTRQETINERQEPTTEDTASMAIEALEQHIAGTTMNQVDKIKRELGTVNQGLTADNKKLVERLNESTRDLDKAESNAMDMEGACKIMESEKRSAVKALKIAEGKLEATENEHGSSP